MTPDLVIHSNDIGPENVLPQITKAGLTIKAFGGANTIDSARLLLKELGSFFKVEQKADSIIAAMDKGIAAAADTLQTRQFKDSVSVMIIHFGLRNNNYFVMSGRNGVGDKMIRLAGCKPAAYDGKGCKGNEPRSGGACQPRCYYCPRITALIKWAAWINLYPVFREWH